MSPDQQRVLVVDDEHLIAATLSLILQKHGFEATAAYCGTEALALLDPFRPDVLISDVIMPDIDGRDVAKAAAQRYPGIRIFLLTGHAHHVDFSDLQRAGVTFEVIAKPTHPNELMNHLAEDSPLMLPTKPRALVVDDFEPHRYSVRRLLQRSGFEVIEATNARECMDLAASNPDIFVLDIHLPDGNGFDLCRKLRANDSTASTPIVHLSSTATTAEAKEESRLVGADDFMTSPFDPDLLLVRLRSLVQAHMLTEEAPETKT